MKYKLIILKNKTRVASIYVNHDDRVQEKLIKVLEEKGAKIVSKGNSFIRVHVSKNNNEEYDYEFRV